MAVLGEVAIASLPPERYEALLTEAERRQFGEAIVDARRRFGGATIFNVNTTAYGGGVAEMLHSLLAYVRGAGVNARWMVVTGTPDFFQVTKRLHNHLHGMAGDGGSLDEQARIAYQAALAPAAAELARVVTPDDCVFLHDPHTVGLAPALRAAGLRTVWRCHIGMDEPNGLARRAQAFLIHYAQAADVCVFSRSTFAWDGLDPDRVSVIPPSLDAFSPKNYWLDEDAVGAILAASGLLVNGAGVAARFQRSDGSTAHVARHVDLVGGAGLPPDVPLVTQVSRWDRLKDHPGVMDAFVRHVAPRSDAHLVLAGPDVSAVADDPEGLQVLQECIETWRALPMPGRGRVHLVCLPMHDSEENAVIVNAIQRRSAVVVQKSLVEGFGLTVTEAMWKRRPVVASRIGGIQDQIQHGRSGMLLDTPDDLAAFGDLVVDLLENRHVAEEMGRSAQETVRGRYLAPHGLMRYANVLNGLLG
jgi:trehalose synthase